MLDERIVQTVSTPFNIFKKKENVESMLNENLNQFKFDSTRFQQAFDIIYAFNNFERRTCSNAYDIWLNNCTECLLKQMLKPFKRALREQKLMILDFTFTTCKHVLLIS